MDQIETKQDPQASTWQRPVKAKIFSVLSDNDQERLASECHWIKALAGQELVYEGQSSRNVFFIQQGIVRVQIDSGDGQSMIYRDCGPGDVIGELSALDNKPCSARALAKTDCILARLSATRFVEWVCQYPQVAHAELIRLSELVRDLTCRQLELATYPVKKRLCASLLRSAKDCEGDCCVLELPTHEEIAFQIGSRREVVTKALSQLRAMGAISGQGRVLRCSISLLNAQVGEDHLH